VEITLFYITTGDKETASRLSHQAVELKLAACGNIFPINSIFPWENAMQHDEEFALILKTVPALKEKLRAFIKRMHPYDVPCIISWDVDVNEEYYHWIQSIVIEN
jgi:periplasmic divalent cation tolerance protein